MKPPHDLAGKDKGPSPTFPPIIEEPGRGIEIAGVVLSLVWALLILGFLLISPPGSDANTFGLVATMLMVCLPVALIWVVVITLRSVRGLRAEAARLQATVEAMRTSYVQAQAQLPVPQQGKSSVERKIDEIAASTRQAETVLTTFISRRDAALSVPSADRKAALAAPIVDMATEQSALALGSPAEDLRAPMSVQDFVRAMHFPESPDDREGFRAPADRT